MDSYFHAGITKEELKELQLKLSRNINQVPLETKPQIIAGYDSHQCENQVIGKICYFDIQNKELIGADHVSLPKSDVPEYEPGFLTLLEMPVFLELWEKVDYDIDIVVIDGNGIIHPRKCGFATHLSFVINKPTFGIAKNLLFGSYNELPTIKGAICKIYYQGEVVGAAVRTRSKTKPAYISVGNDITLEESVNIALSFAKYRIPELTRQPDIRVRKFCRKLRND